ncbi:MAG TPA: helix-turn-helix domain-containing protein [Bryobacteraceae bacterium]|nr:helix-turn-helix domain-containing protein [Bryobacteraceae bacterium]
MATAVQVIQSAAAAEKLLKPERLRMLELLTEPDSATGLAKKLNLPRQTVNYHLRELEQEGFVELVEKRLKGNCFERVVRATARSYVISPIALGALGLEAGNVRDQFSAAYLVSAAARAIRDVSILRQRADKAGKKLATLTLETEVRFADAKSRQRFTEELLNLVAGLAMKYHDDKAEGGRKFRLLLGSYPTITKQEPADRASVRME